MNQIYESLFGTDLWGFIALCLVCLWTALRPFSFQTDLHPNQIRDTWICSALHMSDKTFRLIWEPIGSLWSQVFVCVTGLLPVFASLCVYCLWTEMKQASVVRQGKPGEMLTSTAVGVPPKTHTQGSHQNSPVTTLLLPTLLQRAINLQKTVFLFFFFHILSFVSVHVGTKSMSFTLCLLEPSGRL